MTDAESFALTRSGLRPLAFRGRLLARATSEPVRRDPDAPARWFELAAYRTEKGLYVVSTTYRTDCPGEPDYSKAYDGPRLSWELAVAANCDPMPPYRVGYPPGSRNHRRRQARLEAELLEGCADAWLRLAMGCGELLGDATGGPVPHARGCFSASLVRFPDGDALATLRFHPDVDGPARGTLWAAPARSAEEAARLLSGFDPVPPWARTLWPEDDPRRPDLAARLRSGAAAVVSAALGALPESA